MVKVLVWFVFFYLDLLAFLIDKIASFGFKNEKSVQCWMFVRMRMNVYMDLCFKRSFGSFRFHDVATAIHTELLFCSLAVFVPSVVSFYHVPLAVRKSPWAVSFDQQC